MLRRIIVLLASVGTIAIGGLAQAAPAHQAGTSAHDQLVRATANFKAHPESVAAQRTFGAALDAAHVQAHTSPISWSRPATSQRCKTVLLQMYRAQSHAAPPAECDGTPVAKSDSTPRAISGCLYGTALDDSSFLGAHRTKVFFIFKCNPEASIYVCGSTGINIGGAPPFNVGEGLGAGDECEGYSSASYSLGGARYIGVVAAEGSSTYVGVYDRSS